MDYDSLPATYRTTQQERVRTSLRRMRERTNPLGRLIPETEDLVIGEGRRLAMAVLFLDISGFSGRLSETQAEQDAILSAFTVFFTEMVRIAEDYGGTVEKNTGDGLMAYFEDGGGTPAEDGAKRAVACALTMMDTAAQVINPLLNAAQIAPLSFRIVIDHGRVTIARVGAAKRFNSIVAIGTAANVASKMLAFAQRDEVVIGDSVKTRLPASWQLAWTQLIDQDTGWVYRATGLRYPFHRYIGRWIRKPRGLL